MVTINIDLIDRNYVIVEGIYVARPARLSPSQWLESWEQIKDIKENEEDDE